MFLQVPVVARRLLTAVLAAVAAVVATYCQVAVKLKVVAARLQMPKGATTGLLEAPHQLQDY